MDERRSPNEMALVSGSRHDVTTVATAPVVGNLSSAHCPVSTNAWPIESDTETSPPSPIPNMDTLHHLPTDTPSFSKSLKHRSRRPRAFSNGTPIKASRASKQYIFDVNGQEYLDCINATAHIGHCHPQVVAAGQGQLARLTTAQGFLSENVSAYVKELLGTLPEGLNVCYLCNSGSEANDLAIRLATQYTGNKDVLVHDGTYHGNLDVLVDISPKIHKALPERPKKDWVHILPLPNLYNPHDIPEEVQAGTTDALWEYYTENVRQKIDVIKREGINLAAFISDPFLVIPGLYIANKTYMNTIYSCVRDAGGLVIADEVQTGLGRSGRHFWGFQNYDVVPDIVTVGKPLGNGYPMAAVICRKEISEKLGGYFSTFGGNPVACSIGLAVLDVIYNEKLVSAAKNVGRIHGSGLQAIKEKYPDMLGDVRGQGLVWALEFITDRQSKNPASETALNVMYGLKTKRIVVGVTGEFRNIIVFTPPMCFTVANSRTFCAALDSVLAECVAAMSMETMDLSRAYDSDSASNSPDVLQDSSSSSHHSRSIAKRPKLPEAPVLTVFQNSLENDYEDEDDEHRKRKGHDRLTNGDYGALD